MASSDFHVGDLQGQIEEINEHIAQLGHEVAIVHGYANDESNVAVNYPTGFSNENTVVVNTYFLSSNDKVFSNKIDVVLYANSVSIWNHTGSNRECYAVLMK